MTIKAAVAESKPFVAARENSSSLLHLVAKRTGNSRPAVQSGMGIRAVPREPPVGKKSVDRASEVGLAAGLQTLVGRCSVTASGPEAEHALG